MFSGRGRRVAACTALALSAGMLLATPASAADPAPVPSVEKVKPSFTPPKLVLPGKADGSARAGAQAAQATSPLLSDLDLDGADDLLFRASDGQLYTTAGDAGLVDLYRFEDIARDIIPIGNQNGQAEPEVLVLSESGALTLYQDVDPTGTPYEYPVGGGWQVYNKITSPGDVNNDGRADVIARDKAGQLFLYLATGSPTKPLGTKIPVGGGWNTYDQLIGAGDVNGDGRADLYGRKADGQLYFYFGTGSTTRPFETRKLIGGGWGKYNQVLPTGQDGSLLARDNAGALYLYLPKGDGTLSAPQKVAEAGVFAGIDQFALGGNVPYTGKDGLMARDSAGTLWFYGSSTTGKLNRRQAISDTGEWAGATWTNLSSLNSDGYADVLQNLSGDLYIDMLYIGGGWGGYNAFVGAGDLSGDGKGDLLARDGSGVLYLYKGNGQGDAFSSRIRVGSGWGGYNKLFGAGDYTGDGRTDLLARTTGGVLYLYAGTGNAAAPFAARKEIGSGWNTYKHLAAAGDLNADGKGDIVGATSGGDLYTYLNTTPGKFSGRSLYGPGFQIYNQIS
ncbi:FG-GAP-like repeat-containing protein [Streptomyces sp. NE5-10]|uniref:FG-GAP-like repeat-containing protein n=1 Tax=Streptomyces sp. NE5-10 TaxID=2759674 RepID=UPI001F5B6DC5|nr:FG-GAP-like repeat-containing protein [Streptomyces sp. NE5-10]